MIEPIVRLTGSVLMAAAWCARLFWYHAVPLFVVLWATYVVQVYRVRGNAVLAVLPVVGVVMAALWTVFLLSELLNVLNANDRLARVVKYIERGSLIVIGAYGVLAGLLWINGQSAGPVVRQRPRPANGSACCDFHPMRPTCTSGEMPSSSCAKDDCYCGESLRFGGARSNTCSACWPRCPARTRRSPAS